LPKKKGRGWWGEKQRHSEAAKKGWLKRYSKLKTPSMEEIKERQRRRSKRARAIDNQKRASVVLKPGDRRTALWMKRPGDYDIEGVDTPATKPSKGKSKSKPKVGTRKMKLKTTLKWDKNTLWRHFYDSSKENQIFFYTMERINNGNVEVRIYGWSRDNVDYIGFTDGEIKKHGWNKVEEFLTKNAADSLKPYTDGLIEYLKADLERYRAKIKTKSKSVKGIRVVERVGNIKVILDETTYPTYLHAPKTVWIAYERQGKGDLILASAKFGSGTKNLTLKDAVIEALKDTDRWKENKRAWDLIKDDLAKLKKKYGLEVVDLDKLKEMAKKDEEKLEKIKQGATLKESEKITRMAYEIVDKAEKGKITEEDLEKLKEAIEKLKEYEKKGILLETTANEMVEKYSKYRGKIDDVDYSELIDPFVFNRRLGKTLSNSNRERRQVVENIYDKVKKIHDEQVKKEKQKEEHEKQLKKKITPKKIKKLFKVRVSNRTYGGWKHSPMFEKAGGLYGLATGVWRKREITVKVYLDPTIPHWLDSDLEDALKRKGFEGGKYDPRSGMDVYVKEYVQEFSARGNLDEQKKEVVEKAKKYCKELKKDIEEWLTNEILDSVEYADDWQLEELVEVLEKR